MVQIGLANVGRYDRTRSTERELRRSSKRRLVRSELLLCNNREPHVEEARRVILLRKLAGALPVAHRQPGMRRIGVPPARVGLVQVKEDHVDMELLTEGISD